MRHPKAASGAATARGMRELRPWKWPRLITRVCSLFSEASYNGIGFGLGFAVNLNPAQTRSAGIVGEYHWGGAATTLFWIDPARLCYRRGVYPIGREVRTMVYATINESNL